MPSTPIFMRIITCTNFLVTSSALTFQVTVLYPGHKQVKADLEALRADHQRVLKMIEEGGLARPQQVQAIEKSSKSITERLSLLTRSVSSPVAAAPVSA
ncbi:hypothetical protein TD95_000277 [Thielaviopsis punctulata]|uniref:Uncharacterized protein n=1 Tax=Thielaviopsis punctulata TaxID=72032 RepID=A0A0F4ZE43_9PEZI|nr:hypothetical protein TD95_000277 [Thielaviopsis punctulata]